MKTLQIILNAFIRYALIAAIGFLVKHKIIDSTTLSTIDIAELVGLVSAGLGVLGWAIYTRLRAEFEKLVALKLPKNATPSDVKDVVKDTPVSTIVGASPSAVTAAVNRAGLILVVCLIFSCTPSKRAELKQKASVAGSYLVKDVLSIARNTVDRFARSQFDAVIKNGYMQSSGDLLRSLEDSAIGAGNAQLGSTLQQQISLWLPDKSHWQNYADQIAAAIEAYVKAHPNDPNALNQALEIAATTLQTKPPAVVTPNPTPAPSPVETPTPSDPVPTPIP